MNRSTTHCHDRGHELGGDAHRDREGEEQRVEQRLVEGDVEDEDGDREHAGDAHEERREFAQPLLERGGAGAFGEPGRDAAKRCRQAGCDHDAASGALVHDRAHEGAGVEVDATGVRLRIHRLRDRHRLAREDRLVAFKRIDLEKAKIGWHDVAHREADDVAHDERRRVDQLIVPVAADERPVVDLRMERLDGALRPVLVEEAQQHADRDDRRDDDRVGGIAGEPRDRRTSQQQEEQRVPELSQQHAGGRDPVFPEHVAALALEQFGGLR